MASSSVSSISGGSRRSSRGNSSGGGGSNNGEVPVKIAPLKSLRRIQYCTEFPLPTHLMCSGCSDYNNSPTFNKGGDRAKTHSSMKYDCKQPWKVKPDAVGGGDRYDWNGTWYQRVQEYIDTHFTCTVQRVQEESAPTSTQSAGTKRTMILDGEEFVTETPECGSNFVVGVEEDGRKKKKCKEDIGLMTKIVSSGGHEFEVHKVPASHEIILSSELSRLRNMEQQLKVLKEQFNSFRFAAKPSPFMKSLLSVALASCPSLPLFQAANIIPLIVAAFLVDLGVLDKSKIDRFCKSFPSDTYLRDMMFEFAAENTLELGRKLQGKLVFLACDKGNKKGVGHFVKILSWYDGKKKAVVKQILDIDASEGSTENCADAIEFSMKKLGGNVKLQGQTTDSGGGGVLDGLADLLGTRGLCHRNYTTTSCSLHNLQLSLANPVKELIGEGGLEKKNVLQLLHSIYDLQDAMELDVWKTHVEESMKFMEKYYDIDGEPVPTETEADKAFAVKWSSVTGFVGFPPTLEEEYRKQVLRKLQAPVLTRWWTVGAGAHLATKIYLLLVRITQNVINCHPTRDKKNKIASGLQPLLLEPEIFSDLALVDCFHTAFFCPHLDWIQSATDLTNVPGFQSHNTLGRYFIMVQDLLTMKATMMTIHPNFELFRISLTNLTDQSQQMEKARRFMDLALAAIHKHFGRWCNVSLLPASLLAEEPIARVVAMVMQKRTTVMNCTVFQSVVHAGRSISLQAFYNFLIGLTVDMPPFDPMTQVAAQLVLDNGLDLRNQADFDMIRDYMQVKFLALPSHTQFVEAGVKEAKLVSQSDRSEQLRSAYAICRSARVHNVGTLRDMSATQRIEALMCSARDHYKEHNTLRNDDNYSATVASIIKSMRKEPFKKDRLGRLKDDAVNNSKKNRAENAIQRRRGVDQTTLTQGLVAYGKLKKSLHHNDLEVELLHRGCTVEEVTPMGIRDRITRLKALETERVGVGNNGSGAADKAFKPLSTAPFTLQSNT